MTSPTIAQNFIKSALKGLSKQGLSEKEVLLSRNLSPKILDNPKLRISALEFAELCHHLSLLLADEGMGLLAQPQPLGSWHLLAKACACSETLVESLLTYSNGTNWLDSSISSFAHIDTEKAHISFDCEKAEGIDDDYITDSVLLTCHRFHCWLAEEFIPINRVDLTYPEPEFSSEHRFVFYGAPINYNQSKNTLHFDTQHLHKNIYRDRSDIKTLSSNIHVQLLTQPKQNTSPAIKVRLWMEKQIREGRPFPKLETAAEKFALSKQTLRRRLAKDGYSFQKLKDDTCRDLAIHYIKQSEHSIEEIAFKLGYSEASTFIRAFKNWTGVTPLTFRKL